ncbi:nitrogenase component 1 [Paenibacillus durus]|uniref:nitrogenase component 1 n=1 Tax=Paenibacillus durus TaxID=44251 RepID=UPI0009E05C03|nr:nitrogenase component 1 [Paenibacillus durus]
MPRGNTNLFIEPDCEHNAQKNKGCASPKPGELTKGCAFQGSRAALLPISDAAHLVHGTPGCLENSRGMLEAGALGVPLSRFGFSTGLTEEDIVLGGEKKLIQAIDYIAESYNPPCLFVYATCITMLTMDNLDAICAEAEQKWNKPVIPVHHSGFFGSKNMGYRQAGEALFEKVIGTSELNEENKGLFNINLIGEYHFSGEGKEIEALLSRLGIRVVSRIAGQCSFQDLRCAHSAKVNMLVCSRSMITLARKMRESFGIPYFEGSFYGTREIRFSLQQLSFHFQDAQFDKRVQRYIRREEERVRKDIYLHYKSLQGKKVVLYTDGIESWAFISPLLELGIKIVGIGTNKNALEDLSRIMERTEQDTILVKESDENRILQLYREHKADLMIVSGRNAYVPLKEKLPFLDIDQERHGAYSGYMGLRRMAQDLVDVMEQPVWEMARRRSPWEGEPDEHHI